MLPLQVVPVDRQRCRCQVDFWSPTAPGSDDGSDVFVYGSIIVNTSDLQQPLVIAKSRNMKLSSYLVVASSTSCAAHVCLTSKPQ